MTRHTYTSTAACINVCIAALAYGYLHISYNFLVFSLMVDACIDSIQGICNITAHLYPLWHRVVSYGQATMYLGAGSIILLHNMIHAHSIPQASPTYMSIFLIAIIFAKGYIVYAIQRIRAEVSSRVIFWDTIWDILLLATSIATLITVPFSYKLAHISWYAGTVVGCIMTIQGLWYIQALRLHTNA